MLKANSAVRKVRAVKVLKILLTLLIKRAEQALLLTLLMKQVERAKILTRVFYIYITTVFLIDKNLVFNSSNN